MISKEEVSFTFDIAAYLDDVPEADIAEVVDEVGAYLVESILDYVGEAKSPVAGGEYESKLSTDYADREKGGDTLANLDLNGDMLNALTFEPDYENGTVKVGIFDETQAIKAYNHNVGDTLPQRQFIPTEDELLKAEILRGVKRIIDEYRSTDTTEAD